MIDCHCHLEQKEYDGKLDFFMEKWRKELRFIVTSCAHPQDLKKTLNIYQKFKPFVKICIGLHPTYIKDINEKQINHVIQFIHYHLNKISAIGEIGLDYHYVQEQEAREKQKELFLKFIKLAKELNLPLVVHSREASEEAIKILEEEEMQRKKVLMHLLQEKQQFSRVIENNWFVSFGPSILKSKNIKKIARDCPLNRILLETDSPWFKQEGQEFGEPINVKIACQKIAEIKKLSLLEVEKQTDLNAQEFFNLR
ncbi:MAG: TatD family hydrolase [Candidatus Pacearchaeota archaeon]